MAETLSEPAPKPRRRWLKRLALLAVIGFTACGALWLYSSWRELRDYNRLIAELDAADPGWRLEELQGRRPPVPDALNAALVVEAASAKFPRGWNPNPELARLALETQPPARPNAEQLALLDRRLGEVADALVEARKLVERPRARFAVNWQGADWLPGAPSPRVSPRPAAFLLELESVRLAARGRTGEAARLCLGMLNAGRSLDGDPGRVQLARFGCRAAAVRHIEYALSQGEVAPGVLLEVQSSFADEEGAVTAVSAMRTQRAFVHAGLEAARTSPDPPERLQPKVYSHAGHTYLLRGLTDLVELFRRHSDAPWETARTLLPRWDADVQRERNNGPAYSALTGHTAEYEAAVRLQMEAADCVDVLKALYDSRGLLRSAGCALAAERFRAEKTRWPTGPDELVPAYLPAWPVDPIDGRPLRWLRRPDGLTVYSVGRDGRDDGGTITPNALRDAPQDTGFRLWDPGRRRQAPATGDASARKL